MTTATLHTIYLALGSNVQGDTHLSAARQLLGRHFNTLSFSRVLHTTPIAINSSNLFSNQLCRATTTLALAEVHTLLHTIEHQLATTPKEKAEGRIYIDIDLIRYDNIVTKPTDINRPYVKQLLAELP